MIEKYPNINICNDLTRQLGEIKPIYALYNVPELKVKGEIVHLLNQHSGIYC
jgi:hypothetical protein